jgi:hypothetical protein
MHVKLCFIMRGALDLLDFDDESINDMKRMLLQVGTAAEGTASCMELEMPSIDCQQDVMAQPWLMMCHGAAPQGHNSRALNKSG